MPDIGVKPGERMLAMAALILILAASTNATENILFSFTGANIDKRSQAKRGRLFYTQAFPLSYLLRWRKQTRSSTWTVDENASRQQPGGSSLMSAERPRQRE